MPLPGALTLTTLSGTYTAPDGTPLGGQLTFTPSSALTNESGHPVLAATPLTVRLQPGTGSFSIDLLNTDNAGLLPDTWMWHAIVAVPGAQEAYFFGLPSTLGPTTDISSLTPVTPPPAGLSFVSSINGQTGAVELADGFGVLPPAGDLGGTTLSPQVTATHLSAPLPVVQGGTGAASTGAALAALGGVGAASPAFTGTPTAPTASALTSSTQVATTAYADSAVAVEKTRGLAAEMLLAPKASPALTGSPTAPTQTTGDTSTKIATDQFVATAAAAAQAAAIAASLPTLATAAASASATLAVNTTTQVTAASNLTMTLPSPVAGALIVVEREAASTGTVAVTGNVRGAGSTTVTLSLPSESEMFLGTSSTWNPVAGHKTLGSLDGRYGQLATASSYTADQYFKSGRPWFDVVAFGADPTGVADSTVAIQTAINTALGLRTDTGVGMTGTTVTDAAAVSGDAGKYVNSPNYPLGCSLISSVTPGTGYVVATSATATLSGQAVGIGTGSAVGARIALGPVYLPRGTYKITSDLIIRSAVGFAFRGAGAWATIITASGAGFTTAALLVDGSLDGVYEGIRFAGDGTEGTATSGSGGGIPDVVRLDWTTAAARSTSANTIRNIRVSSMKYVVGLSLEGNGTAQVDGTTLQDIVITGQQVAGSWSTSGNWQKGIALGNGSSGNNYDHAIYNCSVAACYYGIHCNASGFELFGSQPGANAVDFFLNPGAQISINGVQSQSGGQFIVGTGGAGVELVAVRDILFYTGNLVSSGKWITTTGGGTSWLIENAEIYTAGLGGIGGAGVPLMYFNGNGAKENVTLINVTQAAPPSTGITLTSGGSLIAIGYVQMTSVTVSTVGTLFPLYCVNAGALYQQGTAASRPAAATFGEMFYWATDTSVLSHSSGSAWTTVSPSVSTAPDVQVFTSNGTWTKPSGPAPVTTDVVLITPGGGGGSGRRGAVSTVRCGGGGGAGGTVTRRLFSSADLTSTVTVTVAGQQSGGAAVTADDTSGNAGAGFASCSFGAFVSGFGGQGGQGGTATTGAGGSSALGASGVSGAGVSASTTGGPGVLAQQAVFTAPGGPSGGGITSGNVAGAGAAGNGSGFGTLGTSTGGAVDSTAPTAGAGANAKGATGVSSGSGAASITTAAQQGADAAATAYGVGGAGGGASLNGNNSGAGGKGGGGYCVAVSYFQ